MAKERAQWEGKHYSFYKNQECEYFPCHKTERPEDFNCLFCYCPLYVLGRNCGGNFAYRENGIKDCTNCLLPHKRENFGLVTGRFHDIVTQMAKVEEKLKD